MITKDKMAKYGIVFIIFTFGVSYMLLGHPLGKTNRDVSSISSPNSSLKTADSAEKPDEASLATSTPATAEADVSAVQAAVKLTPSEAKKAELNSYVLQVITTYAGGKYPYLLNDDYQHYNGVTENIFYKGTLMAKANPDGSRSSHCVGLTYEVFFKAMKARNNDAGISIDNFNNMTAANMRDFMLTWYNALGTPKSAGDQLAGAIVKYGLGVQVTKLEDAKAGDFIDFSRTKSGHTAVFINWLKDDQGNIVGFKYWSTQESTNGISYKQEYFSDNVQAAYKGTVNRKQLFIGRVGAVSSYKSF